MNPMTNHKLSQMTHAEYEGNYARLTPATTAVNMPKLAYLLTFAAVILMPFVF